MQSNQATKTDAIIFLGEARDLVNTAESIIKAARRYCVTCNRAIRKGDVDLGELVKARRQAIDTLAQAECFKR